MSYQKAVHLLPDHLLIQIQEYVDGEFIYIPRKNDRKKVWGENTQIRTEYAKRDRQIFESYTCGSSSKTLSEEYYLSIKSIQRIIRQEKLKAHLYL